ncbi:dolichyl-diphosphooligosaccharide--protein glycosyltransferase subunit 2 [Galendromus occidentalis]|uniref:Dolichyl-diphosphooligosaccharide--protein glycosyltransferase subunit 2 n=1 Tax=Galendromus occidentalis TaxID=34638 RepID=A0AAJ6QKS7_9ACAR|nr:dolichyl-diphosphooligosaccharide--protein glycosyltransferase subunit 2 [Galendromus occidentalis]
MKRLFHFLLVLGLASIPSCTGQASQKSPLKEITVAELKLRAIDEVNAADWSSGFESVTYPNKASPLTITDDQRFQMSFAIRDSDRVDQQPHQVFVRIASATKELILVPFVDSLKFFKLDFDLKSKAGQLDNASGRYEVSLIVGDAKVKPILWTIANVHLKFNGEPIRIPDYYEQKPEIVHMFREPEKRPHVFVSNVFSLAVVLLFVVMLLLWTRVGISFGNVTASSLLFQASLAVILYIEYLFYLGNDMFTTLRYLTWAAPFALFFGRRMLAHLAKIEEQ